MNEAPITIITTNGKALEFKSQREAAKVLGLHKNTVSRYAVEGRIDDLALAPSRRPAPVALIDDETGKEWPSYGAFAKEFSLSPCVVVRAVKNKDEIAGHKPRRKDGK